MSRQYSLNRGDHWEISFWLIFDITGGVRLTRGEPDLCRAERGMKMSVKVPHALFKTPTLTARIDIQSAEPVVPSIDLTAVAEALKQSIGCDVDIRITAPEAEET